MFGRDSKPTFSWQHPFSLARTSASALHTLAETAFPKTRFFEADSVVPDSELRFFEAGHKIRVCTSSLLNRLAFLARPCIQISYDLAPNLF
jgi:hypothetical protein